MNSVKFVKGKLFDHVRASLQMCLRCLQTLRNIPPPLDLQGINGTKNVNLILVEKIWGL